MNNDIQNLFDQFIQEMKYGKIVASATIVTYRDCFKLFVKTYPNLNLSMINKSLLLDYFEKLNTRKRRVGDDFVQGVKKSTIATHRSKLNPFFKWLVKNKRIKKNPFDNMEHPNVEYNDIKMISGEDLYKIFTGVNMTIKFKTHFQRTRNIAIFAVAMLAGLRKGEILGLRLMDINFETRMMLVSGKTSKSKMDRMIPINRELLGVLKNYVNERLERGAECSALFLSNTSNTPFNTHGLKHLVKIVNEHSGVKFHMHQFRHTFAVNLVAKLGIYNLQRLLGHKDIRMTEKYLRYSPNEEYSEALDELRLQDFI